MREKGRQIDRQAEAETDRDRQRGRTRARETDVVEKLPDKTGSI